MKTIRLAGEGWSHEPVKLVETAFERWRGLRGENGRAGMLLPTRSVHGLGMRRPFHGVGLTSRGVVSQVRTVEPGQLAFFRNSRYVLELPMEVTPPRVGARLEIHHG